MTYEPKVNDYVIWKRPSGDWEEGWVYFKGDPVDNEKRVNAVVDTIFEQGKPAISTK